MTDSLIRSIQQQIQSWFSQAQAKATETDNGLTDLPDDVAVYIEQKLQNLSSPPAYQTAIQQAIATAVTNWQERLTAPNSLVILGSPVEPIAQLMHQSLRDWNDAPLHPQVPLTCWSRPTDPLTLTQQFQESLEVHISQPQLQSDRSEASRLGDRQTLLVIPSLDQCFLRCIGGWDSVEYLRDLSIHHRDCFWVVGCSHWAWNFLDFVCQISAYFGQVEPLPDLTGEMLQEWLDPIAKTVVQLDDPDDTDGDRQSYWNSLSSQSSGISSIAVQLWLQSLHVRKEDLDAHQLENAKDIEQAQQSNGELPFKLYETPPSLPSLPSFTADERYLLHSLLIHNYASYAHLALTLGEPESQIQSRVQRLLREKVLEFRDGTLSIRAIHYAKLKTELANNNFFVGED